MIDGVVGRHISQDPGHAIGRHCNVPERLRGRPSSQILDSGRLQRHESRVSTRKNTPPTLHPIPKARGTLRISCSFPALLEEAAVIASSSFLLGRKLDAAAKEKRATLFYALGSRVGTCIVGCHLVTNRLSRTGYGTDCVSGRALF